MNSNKYLTPVRTTMMLLALSQAFTALAFAQTTSITLPTNDDTSAFEVKQEDGITVIEAAGDGNVTVNGDVTVGDTMSAQTTSTSGNATVGGSVTATSFYGDGSTLSNVRPIATYAGGELAIELTSTDQVIRYVEITVPSAGVIIVNAVGCAEFKSTESELYRASITTGMFLDYSYMMAGSQLPSSDTETHAESFGAVRGYTVSSPGTYRYNLVADVASGDIVMRDVSMTATFYPTAGAGASKIALVEETQVVNENEQSDSLDLP